jgi:RND family efflux transporter MFP subunit
MQRFPYNLSLLTLLLLAFLVVGCGGSEEVTPEDDHVHGGTAITRWTEETELFFEYPPMIAGTQSEPWAIHVTRLSDFSPVTEGTLTLAFRGTDGTVYTTRSESPVRPGIYTPAPQLPQPGSYELVMDVSGPQLQDRIRVGQIEVYADEGAVPHEEDQAEGGIVFLKEQQWPINFGVAEAAEREIPFTIEVAGEIVPAAGRMAEVAAPVSGLAQARANLSAPAPGDRVRAGQTLVVLSPTSQDNSYAQSKANVERLQREVERLTRLYEAEAIPEKRLIEARHDLEVAQAALEAMGGGTAGDGYNYAVRAPISGVVQARRFTPGQRVEAGAMLFEIVNPGEVWLRLKLPARYASAGGSAGSALFTVEGSDRRYRSQRLVSTGSAIDPASRTLPVIMSVDNGDGSIKIGQFATAQLEVGGTRSGVAVPNEAILNEDGEPVAYVQAGGETFERRPLTLGPTDGVHTLVASGVAAGEYVVVEGAYQVYLASLSTTDIGDHGHAH